MPGISGDQLACCGETRQTGTEEEGRAHAEAPRADSAIPAEKALKHGSKD